MSYLSFFKRARGARPDGSKSVKDFLKMAEAQRHAHFSEGCEELERRTNGHESRENRNRHAAFAQIGKKRIADYEGSGKRPAYWFQNFASHGVLASYQKIL